MIETFCKKIADATSSPKALVAAIVIQLLWISIGSITHMDPFPFVFLLTISNVVQLILIFVLAVAQRDSHDAHAARHEDLKAHISNVLDGKKVEETVKFYQATSLENRHAC